MDFKLSLTVFAAVFIAELGDKTQIATILFASGKQTSKVAVFIAASLALILTSAIAVTAGGLLSNYINERFLRMTAGIGFIVIGMFTLLKA